MKIAVFVEGQTETIVVREFLLKHFEYNNVDIICRRLHLKGNIEKEEYDFPNPDAEHHFQIINVSNDVAVLSQILNREKSLYEAGYDKIIGLRDMYSAAYKNESTSIDHEIITKFREGAQKTIAEKSIERARIFFHFAIMEVEAWFLVLHDIFEQMDASLTLANINSRLKIKLEDVDPEIAFFHPTMQMQSLYDYDKKKGTINALVSHYDKARVKDLYDNPKCSSFTAFWASLVGELK
jgi:hypothetical protein